MKFNVGDKVRVKKIEVGTMTEQETFVPDMVNSIGSIVEIVDINEVDEEYYCSDGWWYVDEWLENVEGVTFEASDNKILFAKVRPNAIIPSKRKEDGAFDIYTCVDEGNIVIQPHETKMIPTGLTSAFSNKYVVILKERGSTGTKGMGQRAGVVDSGYRGEWFVPITNHNEKPLIITKETNQEVLDILSEDYIIYPYTKAITQAIMVEVPQLEIEEISYEELKAIESERGTGCLGASGK